MGPAPIRPPLTARRSAVLSALVLLAACSGSGSSGAPTTDPKTISTTSTSAPAPSLPTPTTYEPLPGEPVPEVKSLAAKLVQTLGTSPVGEGRAQMAARRLGDRKSGV